MIISVDTETTGLDFFHGVKPFYLTICNEEGGVTFWEFAINPLTRQPIITEADKVEIVDRINDADSVVFQNAKFDIRALSTIDIEWKEEWWNKVDDTLYSGHLLASGEPHDLTYFALRYLRVDIKPYEEKLGRIVKECQKIARKDYPNWRLAKEGDLMLPSAKSSKGKEEGRLWKFDMWLPRAIARTKKLPKNHEYWTACQDYSNTDSSVTLPVWKVHKRLLEERGLWELYLERRKLIKVIYAMEGRGVTYSRKRLLEMKQTFTEEAQESNSVCLQIADGKLDKLPDSGTSNAMRELLFDVWKLPVINRSDKTKVPSVDKGTLESWEFSLPPKSKQLTFVRHLRRKRKRDTGIGYMVSYERFGVKALEALENALWEDFRRLHPNINGTGSGTLRMTSQCPNEQNISKQAEADGTSIRSCFGPGPGREWWSIDFKNLELVLPAYEAGEEVMINLFERPREAPYFGSYHLLNASIVYRKEFEECITKGESFKDKYASTIYQWVKNGGFAKQYGAIEESGTVDAAFHKKGAHQMIDKSLTKISALNRACIDFANEHGYVETIPDKEYGVGYPIQCPRSKWGKVLVTVPLNYHIQGSAMWCTCRSMVRCHNFLEQWNKVNGYMERYVQHIKDRLKGLGAFITMQVHDELVFDLPITTLQESCRVVRELKRLMELSGDDLGIPISTDVSFHPNNWGEKVKVDLESAVAA